MELKLKNGERIIMASIQQKNEAEGNAAGKKMSVKLLFTAYNTETNKDELVSEWISFWNGNKPTDPQLYTRISEIPVGEWIVVSLAAPVGSYDAAALEFIHGEGLITGAANTNNEINIIVGKASLKNSQKKTINDNNVYEVVIPLISNEQKFWHKISFWGTKNPNLPDIIEKLVAKDVNIVYVCGKLSPYETSGSAFTSTGYQAETLKVNKSSASTERLPETPGSNSEENTDSSGDVQITIGIHSVNKPMLSTLTNEYDIGWMKSVVTYYTHPANDQEVNQIEAMKRILASKVS